MERYHLITGFSSFLGKRVVASILEEEDARALCLVPPEMVDQARNEFRSLGKDKGERLEILVGRESSMHLGLSASEYRRLRKETRFIHHLPRVDADPRGLAEVEKGVQNVLELAEETEKLERLIHIAPSPAPESALLPLRFSRAGAGIRARIEARLEASLHSLPSTLFRPSPLLGDSRTGEFIPGGISLELAFRWAIPPFPVPLPPPGFDATPFQAVPADWVARTSLRLGRQEETLGGIVHLADPEPTPLGWIWREVARRLGRRSWEPLRWLLGIPLLAERFARPLSSRQTADPWIPSEGLERCPSLPTYLDRLLGWAESQLSERKPGPPSTDPFD